eukprot:TRINITY_DN105080_c1_g1_i1.p1 TRINITY_DN105080_c1_g1~~TRINITY_DN105080_c1_g1_i1.p1  ORF type:complete len:504 (+),score=56.47 TRINITY_DN105080_c1_g1_i1:3427-4938(+)
MAPLHSFQIQQLLFIIIQAYLIKQYVLYLQYNMGNKQSTYSDTFILRNDLPASKRPPVLSTYLDYLQFPLGGILGVTSSGIENFNAIDSSRVSFSGSIIEITAVDFNPIHRTLAVGLESGAVKVLDCKTLSIKDVFQHDSAVPVSALSCAIPSKLLVGYKDGTAKELILPNGDIGRVFAPPSGTLMSTTHIQVVEKGSIVLIGYNSTDKGILECYKDGEATPTYMVTHDKGPILKIQALDRNKTLGVLSNEFSLYNYISGDLLLSLQLSIPGVTDTVPVVEFALVPVTKKLRQVYIGDTELSTLDSPDEGLQGPAGDIIVLGTAEGNVLTGFLSLNLSSKKLQCSIMPQSLYKAQLPKSSESQKMTALFIDPVTDRILIGNADGTVKVIEKAIIRMLNPIKAKLEDEEEKKKNSSWVYRLGLSDLDPLDSIVPILVPPEEDQALMKEVTEIEMVEKASTEKDTSDKEAVTSTEESMQKNPEKKELDQKDIERLDQDIEVNLQC